MFVVHGGIFENRHVTFSDIDALNRRRYGSVIAKKPRSKVPCPTMLVVDGACCAQATKEAKMIEDMTWSDPKPDSGMELSDRGSGILYGPDVTRCALSSHRYDVVMRNMIDD